MVTDRPGYLDFYRTYPQIVRTVPAQLKKLSPDSLPDRKTAIRAVEKVGAASPQLLCTLKDRALVGIDNNPFVSRYQLELPKKEDIRRFFEEKIREEINYGR